MQHPKQSKELTEFYTAYLLWLLMDTPDNSIFRTYYGLCEHMKRWYEAKGLSYEDSPSLEMCEQFEREKPDSYLYPFGGGAQYTKDALNKTMHRNPLRNQWVVDHVDREVDTGTKEEGVDPYPNQSPNLTQFYRHWCAWISDGAPERNTNNFKRKHGLCSSLVSWAARRSLTMTHLNGLTKELQQQFVDAGLDLHYPWGVTEFDHCQEHDTMHKDFNRVAWARDHAR